MPALFPWLPVGFAVNGEGKVRRALSESAHCQFCETTDDNVCLLIKDGAGVHAKAEDASAGKFARTTFGDEVLIYAVFAHHNAPLRIGDIPDKSGFYAGEQLCNLAKAIAEAGECSWRESVYFPATQKILPFGKAETDEERQTLINLLLTSGVSGSTLSPTEVHGINKWITAAEVRQFYRTLDMDIKQVSKKEESVRHEGRPPDEFFLPGQPRLEKLFRGIIKFYHRRDAYDRMKVPPTNGILLHGLPGMGKTYSVEKLAEFLNWEMVTVSLGQVGSKYAHETSKQLAQAFSRAKDNAPAILFMDEFDALGASRDSLHQDYKVEEIAELLQQIESAGKHGILVIAATNRLAAIDKALRRRGRFDEIVEIAAPDEESIKAVLKKEVEDRPHAADLDLDVIARQLLGHSFADVAYLIKQASGIAVENERDEISQDCLNEALQNLLSGGDEVR